jgi:hypothetical protein
MDRTLACSDSTVRPDMVAPHVESEQDSTPILVMAVFVVVKKVCESTPILVLTVVVRKKVQLLEKCESTRTFVLA